MTGERTGDPVRRVSQAPDTEQTPQSSPTTPRPILCHEERGPHEGHFIGGGYDVWCRGYGMPPASPSSAPDPIERGLTDRDGRRWPHVPWAGWRPAGPHIKLPRGRRRHWWWSR